MSSGSLVMATPASWRSLELCSPTKENTHVWPLTRQERSHVWPLCISTVSKTLLQAQHLNSHQAEANLLPFTGLHSGSRWLHTNSRP